MKLEDWQNWCFLKMVLVMLQNIWLFFAIFGKAGRGGGRPFSGGELPPPLAYATGKRRWNISHQLQRWWWRSHDCHPCWCQAVNSHKFISCSAIYLSLLWHCFVFSPTEVLRLKKQFIKSKKIVQNQQYAILYHNS